MSDDFLTRLRARCRACGFTLVELMVTIAVAAILLMIAVPSFQRIILSNKLTTVANTMVNNINLARLDAIKLNATTQFCGSTTAINNPAGDTLGAACATSTGAVYALPQSSGTAGEVQTTVPGLTAPVQVTATGVAAVRFSGQGFGYVPGAPGVPFGNTVATICTSQLASDNQRIISMTGGSILAVATSTGTCP